MRDLLIALLRAEVIIKVGGPALGLLLIGVCMVDETAGALAFIGLIVLMVAVAVYGIIQLFRDSL